MTRFALAWLPEADTLEKEIERDCRQVQMRDDVEVPPELTTEPWNAGASEYVMYGHFKLLHRLMPLVELSPAPWTSPGTVGRTRPLMEGVGQVSVELRREIPGFLLNRLQGAQLGEAFRLVEQGYCAMEDIDKTVKGGLGLRWSFMGAFETIDLNAPGGIADYIHRYGPPYHEMARSAGAPEKWSDALTARLEAERRQTLSSDKLGERAVVGPSIDGTAGAQTEGAGEDWRLTGLADRVIPPSALRRQS